MDVGGVFKKKKKKSHKMFSSYIFEKFIKNAV